MITIIQKEYKQDPYQMHSGQYEAQIRKYNKYPCKKGVYYVAIQDNPADNVYFFNPNETGPDNWRGFGGATLEFTLEDGTVDKCKGPWHTNSEALFEDTGIDIRNTALTFGVIGLGRDFENSRSIIKDVVYIDSSPSLGNFDRIKNKTEELVKEYNRPFSYLSSSKGGSFCAWVFPKGWTREQENQFFESQKSKL